MSLENSICRLCRRPKIEKWAQLWRRIRQENLQENRLWRLLRVVDELGDAAKCLTYHTFYCDAGYEVELKIALADLIAMTHMMIYSCGWSVPEIEGLGMNRLKGAIDGGRLKSPEKEV